MFLSAKTPLLAVDIGSNSIKVAQLAGSGNKYELMSLGVMPLDPEAIVDGVVKDEEHVVDALTRLLKAENITTHYAVSSVAGEAVIIKKIKVPMMSEEELVESINQEAEQYIPFDIDDVRIDFQILESTGESTEEFLEPDTEEEEKLEILLVAVQNEIIDSRSDILVAAGLKPVVIDLDAFAVVNALGISRDPQSLGAVAMIDLGAAFTHVNIILDGVTSFTRDIQLGGDLCSQRLMGQFELEHQDSEAFKRGEIPDEVEGKDVVNVIIESFDTIIDEIQKSFEFFSTTSNAQVEHVFISGGGALIGGVDGLLADRLGVPVEILNPLESVKISGAKFDRESIAKLAPLASVALGLATRRFDY